jgi:hypothetical protein
MCICLFTTTFHSPDLRLAVARALPAPNHTVGPFTTASEQGRDLLMAHASFPMRDRVAQRVEHSGAKPRGCGFVSHAEHLLSWRAGPWSGHLTPMRLRDTQDGSSEGSLEFLVNPHVLIVSAQLGLSGDVVSHRAESLSVQSAKRVVHAACTLMCAPRPAPQEAAARAGLHPVLDYLDPVLLSCFEQARFGFGARRRERAKDWPATADLTTSRPPCPHYPACFALTRAFLLCSIPPRTTSIRRSSAFCPFSWTAVAWTGHTRCRPAAWRRSVGGHGQSTVTNGPDAPASTAAARLWLPRCSL